ncbi:MAG: hypothetical protein IPN29_20045 [Saprospiraceae bacterium]|nr:hypothetical protein [Saprospiraceae bacterium]
MRYYVFALFFIGLSFGTKAQNVTDAVRWSFTNPGGTARTLGVGGSFGAMGGDYSVININPAGLAAYRMSEFTISPSLSHNRTSSFMVGSGNVETKDRFNSFSLDNAALVFANKKSSGGSAFAFGFSKIADLNKNFSYTGSSNGSITRRFAERANGRDVEGLDDFEAYPAYAVGAIYDLDEDKNYETDFSPFDDVRKNQKVDQEGYINELSFGWGGNFGEKFLLGVSAGIPFVSFQELKQYGESDATGDIPVFESLNYTEYLNTSGAGINFKAGFIYAPIRALRFGGAVHSPTWFTLNDDYYTRLDYRYNDGEAQYYDNRSPDGSFKYRLSTPAKAVGSIGTIYKLGPIQGFINGDVEWIDYNNNRFNFTSFSDDNAEEQNTIDINNEIESFLGSVVNVRLGTELAWGVLRLRAGIERGDSPLSADTKKIETTSLGVGVRDDRFFVDLGVRFRKYDEGYVPYVLLDPSEETLVNNKIEQTRVVVTAGFKF